VKKQKDEKKKVDQIREYVKELYRVFLKQTSPSPEEINEFVNQILSGESTLEDVENEFRLKGLNPIH